MSQAPDDAAPDRGLDGEDRGPLTESFEAYASADGVAYQPQTALEAQRDPNGHPEASDEGAMPLEHASGHASGGRPGLGGPHVADLLAPLLLGVQHLQQP